MAKTKASPNKEDDILNAINQQTKVIGDLATAISLLLQNQNSPEEVDKPEVVTKVVKRRGRKPGKKSAEEPVNKFETMKEFKSHKSDSKIDKKLWHDREPSERRQMNSRVEIQCSDCKKTIRVSPDEIGEESAYKCNNCIVGKRS